MKAIETTYAGRRFRSRLEARWAVTFDGLGWGWEYEVEGYATSQGPYLPDFVVTGPLADATPVLVEVKGSIDRLDLGLIQVVAIETRTPVLILGPHPKLTSTGYLHWVAYPPQYGGGWQQVMLLLAGQNVLIYPIGPRCNLAQARKADSGILGTETPIVNMGGTVRLAYMNGAGSRFEHGENPRSQPHREDPWAPAFTATARQARMEPSSPVEVERARQLAALQQLIDSESEAS